MLFRREFFYFSNSWKLLSRLIYMATRLCASCRSKLQVCVCSCMQDRGRACVCCIHACVFVYACTHIIMCGCRDICIHVYTCEWMEHTHGCVCVNLWNSMSKNYFHSYIFFHVEKSWHFHFVKFYRLFIRIDHCSYPCYNYTMVLEMMAGSDSPSPYHQRSEMRTAVQTQTPKNKYHSKSSLSQPEQMTSKPNMSSAQGGIGLFHEDMLIKELKDLREQYHEEREKNARLVGKLSSVWWSASCHLCILKLYPFCILTLFSTYQCFKM